MDESAWIAFLCFVGCVVGYVFLHDFQRLLNLKAIGGLALVILWIGTILVLLKLWEHLLKPIEKALPDNRVVAFFSVVGFLGIWIGIIFIPGAIRSYGPCRPGAVFERDDYEAEVLVNLFPEGSRVKNCRVPAVIRASIESDSDGDDSWSWRPYPTLRARMPNGGTIAFEGAEEDLELGERVTLLDASGREREVELTDRSIP